MMAGWPLVSPATVVKFVNVGGRHLRLISSTSRHHQKPKKNMGKGVDEHGSFNEAEELKSDINTRQLFYCFTDWKQEAGANCLLRNCQFITVVERTNKLSLHHRQLANSLGRFGRWLTFLDSPRRYKSISPVRLAILKESNRISGRSDGRMRISCEIPYG